MCVSVCLCVLKSSLHKPFLGIADLGYVNEQSLPIDQQVDGHVLGMGGFGRGSRDTVGPVVGRRRCDVSVASLTTSV